MGFSNGRLRVAVVVAAMLAGLTVPATPTYAADTDGVLPSGIHEWGSGPRSPLASSGLLTDANEGESL